MPFIPLEEEFTMQLTKFGIEVSISDQHDVLHGYALYLITWMVCYDDDLGAGKSLLALKTTDVNNVKNTACGFTSAIAWENTSNLCSFIHCFQHCIDIWRNLEFCSQGEVDFKCKFSCFLSSSVFNLWCWTIMEI